MENIIEVENVSKSFGGVKANIDISLLKSLPIKAANLVLMKMFKTLKEVSITTTTIK